VLRRTSLITFLLAWFSFLEKLKQKVRLFVKRSSFSSTQIVEDGRQFRSVSEEGDFM